MCCELIVLVFGKHPARHCAGQDFSDFYVLLISLNALQQRDRVANDQTVFVLIALAINRVAPHGVFPHEA